MNGFYRKIALLSFLLFIGITIASSAIYANVSTTLHEVTWKGKKWEYLVEHPTDFQGINMIRFEEILDDVGHHGWQLVQVTVSNHFYAFYFERELLPHKLEAHRSRLKLIKEARAKREKEREAQLVEAHLKKLTFDRNEKLRIEQKKQLNQELQELTTHVSQGK